mgnify:CR=1 FL=1
MGFGIIIIVSGQPSESLDKLRARVRDLETPRPTSPIYWKIGWPMLAVGALLWFIEEFLPGPQYLMAICAFLFLAMGAASVGIGAYSAHSEGVEQTEKERRIKERSKNSRCLYLEGNVPDGKGIVGRCRLYEFDMVDLPYCLYCREYTPQKGSPNV